jgi:hypothetical protein
MRAATQKELLDHYADGEPRVVQYHGVSGVDAEDIMEPDENGYVVYGEQTCERPEFDVKVLVDPKAKREDVLALLEKITAWLRRGGAQFEDHKIEEHVECWPDTI